MSDQTENLPEDEETPDWRDGLAMDIEAPHCHECDDWHWGPCPPSSDQLTG